MAYIQSRRYYRANQARIDAFHQQTDLTFTAVDLYDLKSLDKMEIHHSRPGLGTQGSRYYVAFINDRPAYIRVSNHWGVFFPRGVNDEGETCYISHRWELDGGARRKDGEYPHTSQAGYVYLD